MTTKFLLLLFIVGTLIACASHDLDETMPFSFDCDGSEISYNNSIKGLIQEKCSQCHNAGFVGKNWQNPVELQAKASEVRTRILIPEGQTGHMPQQGSLSPQQIKLIKCWVENGAPIDN